MTTFQDPQPQSRRAVRQGERGENPDNVFPAQFSPEPTTSMWDTTARRAAQLPPASPRTDAPPATSGRRAAPASPQPAPAAEPLTYSTQSRPAVPSYDGAVFRNRASAPPREEPQQAPIAAEQPGYRVRDFSPEGRRAARAAETPAPAWQQSAPVAPASDLDYHTEVRFAAAPAPAPALPVEQTLSRRELRALQQSEQDASAQPQPAASAAPAPAGQSPAAQSPFDALFQAPPAPQYQSQQPLPPVAPEPAANTALTAAMAEFDSLTTSQPGGRPVGHWSTQLDEEDGLPETTINRTIGSGHTATNALVLPAIPQGNDIRGPLTGTGEIMLTGSIDLPRTLSATGASDRFDHAGIDGLFDANDHELTGTDSSPVRAIRAVSTHTSGHGVTHTQKPKGTKALTALLIAASSMAVVVAALLVAAFAFNVF
jgi:hypothetical protein